MLPTYTSVIEDYLGSWTNHYDIHKNALFQKKKKKKKKLLQNPNQQNNTPHQKLIS